MLQHPYLALGHHHCVHCMCACHHPPRPTTSHPPMRPTHSPCQQVIAADYHVPPTHTIPTQRTQPPCPTHHSPPPHASPTTHPASRSLPLASTALLLLSLSPFRPIAPPASPPPPPAGGGHSRRKGGGRQPEVRSNNRDRGQREDSVPFRLCWGGEGAEGRGSCRHPQPRHTTRHMHTHPAALPNPNKQPQAQTNPHPHPHTHTLLCACIVCVCIHMCPLSQASGQCCMPHHPVPPPSHLLPLTLVWVCCPHQPAWAGTSLCACPEQQHGTGGGGHKAGQGRAHTVRQVRVQV